MLSVLCCFYLIPVLLRAAAVYSCFPHGAQRAAEQSVALQSNNSLLSLLYVLTAHHSLGRWDSKHTVSNFDR